MSISPGKTRLSMPRQQNLSGVWDLSPFSAKRRLTVFPLFGLLCVPIVCQAVSAADRKRSGACERRKYRSWFAVVTRGRPVWHVPVAGNDSRDQLLYSGYSSLNEQHYV